MLFLSSMKRSGYFFASYRGIVDFGNGDGGDRVVGPFTRPCVNVPFGGASSISDSSVRRLSLPYVLQSSTGPILGQDGRRGLLYKLAHAKGVIPGLATAVQHWKMGKSTLMSEVASPEECESTPPVLPSLHSSKMQKEMFQAEEWFALRAQKEPTNIYGRT